MITIQHLSAKATELLMLRINSRVVQWLSEWSFADLKPLIDISAHDELDNDMQFHSDGESVIAVSKSYVDWKSLIFSDHSLGVPNDEIFSLVLDSAKRNFYGAVFAAITDTAKFPEFKHVPRGNFTQPPVDSVHDLGPQFISISIRLNKEAILITMPFSTCGNLIESKQSAAPLKLPSIKDINASISARVELRFGSHLLSDINSLEVGDVLSAKTLLTESFDLYVGENKIAKVALGKTGKNKAVSII